MRRTRIAGLLLVSLLAAACESTAPTAIAPAAPEVATLAKGGNGATVTLEEWGPEPVVIRPPAPCLGEDVRLTITGTISGWTRVVERPDGSLHITEYIDMTDLTATLGDRVWTAGPGAHEIWSVNFPPNVPLRPINARQAIHVGNTMFRAEDGRPELKFIHRIHVVRLPSGELQILRVIFEVQCIGPDR